MPRSLSSNFFTLSIAVRCLSVSPLHINEHILRRITFRLMYIITLPLEFAHKSHHSELNEQKNYTILSPDDARANFLRSAKTSFVVQ